MQTTAVRKGRGKKTAFRVLTHLVLILCSITMLIPFLWMISSSLKDLDELFAVPPVWIPKHIAWENYVYMFEQAPWVTYFANTTLVTAAIILGQLVTCSMAAYAFARLKFKGREVIFIIYLGTMMIPFQVVMIPQFQIIKTLGLDRDRYLQRFRHIFAASVLPYLAQRVGRGGDDRWLQLPQDLLGNHYQEL